MIVHIDLYNSFSIIVHNYMAVFPWWRKSIERLGIGFVPQLDEFGFTRFDMFFPSKK